MDMPSLKKKAISLGASDMGESKRKGKLYYVVTDTGDIIHFGSDKGSNYLIHKDDKKRTAWYARHSKIKNKQGEYVINDKSSPSYWSAHLLWPKD